MKRKSEFGKISKVDLLNALYHSVGAVSIPLCGFLASGSLPSTSNLYILLSVFVSALCADIFKNGVTNSEGEKFKKEN
jgi:hypothetical protein